MEFSVKERSRSGPVVVLELSGRLTWGEGSEKLDETLQRLIKGGEPALLLDCAGVSGIDSQGIKSLVRAVVSAHNVKGELKLLKLSQRMRAALEITRLLTVIEHFEDEAAAVRSFAPASGSR